MSFVGRQPRVKLDVSGEHIVVTQKDTPFVMAQQRLTLQESKNEEGVPQWSILSIDKREGPATSVFGDGSNTLWNNKFAKQSRKK